MGNMGDALNKAGLISDRELARSKPRERGDRDQLIERHKIQKEVSADDAAKVRDLVRKHGSRQGIGGRRHWHYVTRDGKVPYLEVNDDLAKRLESGQSAIAAAGDDLMIISDETAVAVDELDPTAILFWVALR